MISIILGGSLEDSAFIGWVSKLDKVRLLNGERHGALAEYAARCKESTKVLKIKNYLRDTEVNKIANDPIVIHFQGVTPNTFSKLGAFVEIALDFELDIQIFTYDGEAVPAVWPEHWPEVIPGV